MNSADNTIYTREIINNNLVKFQNYMKLYKNYPGSPGDDGILGIYGYTVRDERGYIRSMITKYKRAVEWMNTNNKNSITAREFFYL